MEIAETFDVCQYSEDPCLTKTGSDRPRRGSGTTTTEAGRLAAVRGRITELEAELAATKRADDLLRQVGKPLKQGSQVVDALYATQEVLIVLDQGDWFDPAIRSSKTDSGLGSR